MRKKCLAIAKKAMVWTLAASMLVATPLTASAAGLRGVYKVEDGDGKTVGDDVSSDDTRTGTVTSTNSNTAVLNNKGSIKGISLDRTDVTMEMDGAYDSTKVVQTTLTATVITDGKITDKDLEELRSGFRWKTSDRDIVAVTANKDNKVITIDTEEGAKEKRITETVTLNAKAGGNATITVSLDRTVEDEEIHITESADVFVKQYADQLVATNPAEQHVKHTLELAPYVKRVPETANDNITFAFADKTSKNYASLKNGVLTFKKAGTVNVTATSEKGKTATLKISVTAGVPITKLDIKNDFAGLTEAEKEDIPLIKKKKVTLDVSKAKQESLKVTIDKYIGTKRGQHIASAEEAESITDSLTWSSKKPGVVAIEGSGDAVTLVPKAVGSAQISVQATSGSKATLTVTVKAPLTGIEITNITTGETELYSGQTLQVEISKKSGNSQVQSTDAVKWSVANVDEGTAANASINGKGLLAVKSAVTAGAKVKVTVVGKKNKEATDSKELTVQQLNISQIKVYTKDGGLVASSDKKDKKKIKAELNNGETADYTVQLLDDQGNVAENIGVNTLNLSSAKTKFATVAKNEPDKITVSAIAKGSSKITVSGTKLNPRNGKGSKVSAVFTLTVKQPAKSLTLNNTAVTVKTSDFAKKAKKISFTAKFDKGSTSKKNDVTWIATKDGKAINGIIKNGALTIPKGTEYKAGDVIVVTAMVSNDVKATAKVMIVSPSSNVRIYDTWPEGSDPVVFKDKNKTNQTTITLNGSLELKSAVQVSGKWYEPNKSVEGVKVADVTYSVNKKGIVQIVNGTVYPLKAGKVVITAKTSDGKSSKLTVVVPKN